MKYIPEGKSHNAYEENILNLPFADRITLTVGQSNVRDHCANERNFLSYMRLACYLAVVAAAMMVEFRIDSPVGEFESSLSIPMGVIAAVFSLAGFIVGAYSYLRMRWLLIIDFPVAERSWITDLYFLCTAGLVIVTAIILLISAITGV